MDLFTTSDLSIAQERKDKPVHVVISKVTLQNFFMFTNYVSNIAECIMFDICLNFEQNIKPVILFLKDHGVKVRDMGK